MNKIIIVFMGGLAIFMLTQLYFFLQDDELNPGAITLIQLAQPKPESQAFLYLLGIDANETNAPYTLGRKRYQHILQLEQKYINNQNSDEFYTDIHPEEKLAIPKGQLFCSFDTDNCLTSLFHFSTKIDELLITHQTISQRYQTFLDFDEYATLAKPFALSSPTLSYRYITAGNRLALLKSIKHSQTGNLHIATEEVTSNIKKIRKHLAMQDHTLGKRIFLRLLAENIDFLYLLQKHYQQNNLLPMPQLTQSEKSIAVPVAREFAESYYLFVNLIEHKDSSWYGTLLFKPNMTSNLIYPYYKQLIEKNHLSHEQFAKDVLQEYEIEDYSIKNTTGNKLAMVTIHPDFQEYLSQFYDVDLKIKLYNLFINIENINSILPTINNPYYPNKKNNILFKDGNKTCFNGPLPDKNNYRCLPLKLQIHSAGINSLE